MSVTHQVAGYDKRSESLKVTRDVPDAFVEEARRIADAPIDPETAPGAIPLNEAAVRRVSEMLGFPMSADRYDWFLEPYEP